LCGKLEKFADHVEAIYHVECELSADESWLVEEQEAVNNAIKHGRATRTILRMSHLPSSQVLEILDNGCGLDVQTTAPT
jgi:nitrate/nitrite-specific signal transduction histidine kinase